MRKNAYICTLIRMQRYPLKKCLTAAFAALACCAARAADSSEAPAPLLQPELAAVIAAMGAPAPVKLPAPPKEEWDKLDDHEPYPPGVMLYTRQVVVDKSARRLRLVTPHGEVLKSYPVCASANKGQKRKKDDSRTPEGRFEIIGIYNSTDWTYKDTGVKAYGPFFIHLNTHPFYGIGLHGTNAPASVPGRSSHGCVRLHNEDISALRRMVNKDTRVTILPDPADTDTDAGAPTDKPAR